MSGETTAIRRRAPSAPIRLLAKRDLLHGRMLDYGCGRGYDAKHFGMEGHDPHWYPDVPKGSYDTIVCIYVLNVVSPEEVQKIVQRVTDLLAPEGSAYFAVRRDLPREGRPGRGCYQRWVDLDLPVVASNSNFVVYQKTARPDQKTRIQSSKEGKMTSKKPPNGDKNFSARVPESLYNKFRRAIQMTAKSREARTTMKGALSEAMTLWIATVEQETGQKVKQPRASIAFPTGFPRGAYKITRAAKMVPTNERPLDPLDPKT